MAADPWSAQLNALGSYIRSQRQLAQLSLRQLAELASVSNPYLSQLERGLHQPSVRVIKLIAEALGLPAEELLRQAGLVGTESSEEHNLSVESAIRAETRLSEEQRAALIAVFRTMLQAAD
jgi:transcriptional regulator with XRE-family HTH domain